MVMDYLELISRCLKRRRKTTEISVLTLVSLKIQVLRGITMYNILEDLTQTKISVMVDGFWGRM